MPHADPDIRRVYMNDYRRRRYAEDAEYRESVRAASRATPRKVWAAHKTVARALGRGEIVKPLICEECNQGGALEAAHHDYDHPLDIRWLCRFCHRRWDKEQPKAAVS